MTKQRKTWSCEVFVLGKWVVLIKFDQPGFSFQTVRPPPSDDQISAAVSVSGARWSRRRMSPSSIHIE
jgi:hypothetical protein